KEDGNTLIKSFYFDISKESILNKEGLLSDLKQLNYHYSFLVIDNVQDNVDLAFDLLDKLSSDYKNIKTLYISRRLDRYSNSIFRSSTLKNKIFSKDIFELESFNINKTKVQFEGIISKRITFLKEMFINDNNKWSYNSLDAVLSNCKN